MHMKSLWLRESGVNHHSRGDYYPKYSWLLKLFVSQYHDCHRVLGNVNANHDIDTVAGTSVKFCEDYNNADLLAMADEDGVLCIFNTALYGSKSVIARWCVHKNAIFDVEWLTGTSKIVTASGHQVACLVDIATQTTIDEFKGHSSSLKTLASRKTDPYVFATGGRDGLICIWDQRVTRRGDSIPVANEIRQPHSMGTRNTRKSTSQSIQGLCFQDEYTLISCASNDGSIKVWDLRRSYKTQKGDPLARHVMTYHGKSVKQVGYSSLCIDHANSSVYVNCNDDVIYKYSAVSFKDEVVASYTEHKNKTFFVKSAVSPDDRYLLTGSSDHDAVLYDLSNSACVRLSGHTDEVTAVSWCKHDVKKLATISDDDTLMIWRLGDGVLDEYNIVGKVKGDFNRRLTGVKDKIIHNVCGTNDDQPDVHHVLAWPSISGLNIQPKLSSPKKLLISPRKSSTSQLSSLLSSPVTRKKSPDVHLHTSPLVHAKRKILGDESPKFAHKKFREDVCLRTPPSGFQTLSPIRINNSSKIIKNVTPTSSVSNNLTDFSSPTANLPNSVLDPQTPKRPDKENYQRKPDDWLSQYSKARKRRVKDNDSSPVGVTTSAVTPTSSSINTPKSSHKTPTSKKRAAQTLMFYFSPTSAKEKNPE